MTTKNEIIYGVSYVKHSDIDQKEEKNILETSCWTRTTYGIIWWNVCFARVKKWYNFLQVTFVCCF